MASGGNNALKLLSSYDSDSDKDSGYTSEEEKKRKQNFFNPRERKSKKSKGNSSYDISNNLSENDGVSHENLVHVERVIPLPEEILGPSEYIDNPMSHQGRIRSFPHERGNWASLIYIPLSFGTYTPHLNSLLAALIAACSEQEVKLFHCSDYHVSLSFTFILRLEWILPLLEELKKKLFKLKKFSTWLHGLVVYCNQERTRTFLALNVGHGKSEMNEIAAVASDTLKKYNLSTYYEKFTLHASIAWCHGDKVEELERFLPLLQNICDNYFNIESDMRVFEVTGVHLKTGNRVHSIPLSCT